MTYILLIDDDEQFRTMLSLVLTEAGYDVQEASNGREAVRLYRIRPADLVITDLIMPEQEGLATIKEIKTLCRDAKVIAISGGGRNNPGDYLKIAKAFGANRVLAKPFLNSEILEVVESLLLES